MIGIFGLLVALASPAVSACSPVSDTVRYTVAHRGFDADATQKAGWIFTGVNPESPAHAAGLRNGMRLVRREAGTVGDSRVEVAYRVQDGDIERVIRYLPQGAAQVTFQRVLPAPEMAAQACEQRIRAVP